jgi:plastocyanin
VNIARTAALSAVVLLLAVAAAGCGDDDENGDDGGAQAARPSASPTTGVIAGSPTASGGAPAGEVAVTAADFSFTPPNFSVSGGSDTTITLTNSGNVSHTLNIYTDADYTQAIDGAATGRVSPGASGEFTLTSAQVGSATELYFRCEVHPLAMTGEITVE